MNEETFQTFMNSGSLAVPNQLLLHYSKLGLTEDELVLILQIQYYLQKGELFPTPAQLSESMSISVTNCSNLLRGLIQHGFLKIEEYEDNHIQCEKYSIDPLWSKLYQFFMSEMNGANQKKKEQEEGNLYKIFEQEFARPLSPFESETLSIWIDQDHHDVEMIKAALREAVLSGKVNFRYIDRILFDWKKNGITTIEQARQHAKKFRANQQTNKQKPSQTEASDYKRKVPFYNWLEQ
ncbi:DnaD domain-containing protein [Bacillus carboniphilus]|uniref:DnaD domain-containing protein n=1 Tax=Bacillus carboniphilus TaxID=86663 RepID=A0ABY9JWE2_9BACI|nr:DnaD domain-containing protein [Bacillus carboniphilus]WLR43706.1 DnaD domain-containing protein [Bacillus carboniphilus]